MKNDHSANKSVQQQQQQEEEKKRLIEALRKSKMGQPEWRHNNDKEEFS